MAKSSDKKIALIPYWSSSMRIFQIVPTNNITMKGVKNEIDNDDYTEEDNYSIISLEDLSDGTAGAINNSNSADDRPDGVAPHALSEFANYDHDFAGVGEPSNLTYTAASTTSITFTFTEPVGASRVYFFQGTNASFTICVEYQTNVYFNFT